MLCNMKTKQKEKKRYKSKKKKKKHPSHGMVQQKLCDLGGWFGVLIYLSVEIKPSREKVGKWGLVATSI